jgi:hypothetical protein
MNSKLKNSANYIEHEKIVLDKINENDIDIELILNFVKLNWIKLLIALILGGGIGFGLWKYYDVYSLQISFNQSNFDGKNNRNLTLEKLSPILSSLASKNSPTDSGNSNLSTQASQEWWSRNLTLNFEQVDSGSNKVNRLSGFTLRFRDSSATNAMQKIFLAEKLIKEGGALLELAYLLESLSSNKSGVKDVQLLKLQLLIQIEKLERKIKAIEDLQKKGYGSGQNSYIFADNISEYNEKYLPYSVQLNSAALDLYAQKQQLSMIEASYIKGGVLNGSIKEWLKQIISNGDGNLDSIKRVLSEVNAQIVRSKKLSAIELEDLYEMANRLRAIESKYSSMDATYSINHGEYLTLLKLIVCGSILGVLLEVMGLLFFSRWRKN